MFYSAENTIIWSGTYKKNTSMMMLPFNIKKQLGNNINQNFFVTDTVHVLGNHY